MSNLRLFILFLSQNKMKQIVGIDVGGSHITMAQVTTENREIIASTYLREHVDSLAEKEVILSAWVSAIQKLIADLDKNVVLIGVAMPGPFDYENGISLMTHGKFINILNLNVKKELAQRLSISEKQIHFINDAAAFLEGEIFGGAVQNHKRVFGITLGTGLGSTFYDGKVATDEDLWDSPYKTSIFENYLTTNWFIKRYKELTGEDISGTKDLLEKSEDLRTIIFDEYADHFSDFVVQHVKVYNPEVLVIGGNIAKAYPYFQEKLTNNLENNNINLPIKISAIFEDAAILGAASYALKQSSNY